MCICFVEYHIEGHSSHPTWNGSGARISRCNWSQAIRKDGSAAFICRSMGSSTPRRGRRERIKKNAAASVLLGIVWRIGCRAGSAKIHAWTFKPVPSKLVVPSVAVVIGEALVVDVFVAVVPVVGVVYW